MHWKPSEKRFVILLQIPDLVRIRLAPYEIPWTAILSSMCYRSSTGRWPVWAWDYLCNKRTFCCFVFCSKTVFGVENKRDLTPLSLSVQNVSEVRTAHYGLFLLQTHETVRILTSHCTSVDTTQLVLLHTHRATVCVYCERWAETLRRHWYCHCYRRMLHLMAELFSSQSSDEQEQPLLQQSTLTTLWSAQPRT